MLMCLKGIKKIYLSHHQFLGVIFNSNKIGICKTRRRTQASNQNPPQKSLASDGSIEILLADKKGLIQALMGGAWGSVGGVWPLGSENFRELPLLGHPPLLRYISV
jgi:hypothetical protein